MWSSSWMVLNRLTNPDANTTRNRCPLSHSEEKGMRSYFIILFYIAFYLRTAPLSAGPTKLV